MDPDKALEDLRAAVRKYHAHNDNETSEDFNTHDDACESLARAADALDQWLSRGGFLPRAWKPEISALVAPEGMPSDGG